MSTPYDLAAALRVYLESVVGGLLHGASDFKGSFTSILSVSVFGSACAYSAVHNPSNQEVFLSRYTPLWSPTAGNVVPQCSAMCGSTPSESHKASEPFPPMWAKVFSEAELFPEVQCLACSLFLGDGASAAAPFGAAMDAWQSCSQEGRRIYASAIHPDSPLHLEVLL